MCTPQFDDLPSQGTGGYVNVAQFDDDSYKEEMMEMPFTDLDDAYGCDVGIVDQNYNCNYNYNCLSRHG